ncbi:LamG domain-containing protein, partial [uncultured Lutibacter sp.]|uniref:LamG domain-containing protein n=1 Tax=uncultured Lutibacter sp. TaxID=437739 RepID=UPI00262F7977
GVNNVVLTVTDTNGQSATGNATVTVEDTTPPITPTLATINEQCSSTVPIPTTTDNCGKTITGTTTDPLTYTTQGAHNINWTFDDGNGNSITVTQTVVINDTQAPIASCKDITVQLSDTDGTVSITAAQLDDGSSDNCNFTITLSKTDFDCTNIGDNFVVFTVTDDKGNKDTCTSKVTVTSPNIDGGTLTGYLDNTETSADADDIIEVTACPEGELKNAYLNLTGEQGTISHWESSTDGGLNWAVINNTSDNYYLTDITETTLVRAVVEIGSCKAASTIVLISVIPPDIKPTIVGPSQYDTCMGTAVTLEAQSEFGVTPDFNEGGLFNQANLNTLGWTVDGAADMSAAGSNTNNTYWKETTGPKKFNGRCYGSPDGTKFAIVSGIPPYETDHTITPISTLETSVFNTLGLTTASLEFDQAYFLESGAWVKIELSLDNGATYPITLDPGASYDYTGPSDTGFSDQGFTGQCKNSLGTLVDNHVSIDLSDYIGLIGLRIKFTYSGTANSAWALENISIPQAPVDEVIEWTDENGVVVSTGSTVNITPVTPGIQTYGVTSLINGCRANGDEGTEYITMNVSSAYAGEDIIPIAGECGLSIVTLAAYDNSLSALQNYANGVWDSAYTLPDLSAGDTDYPGTGESGYWSLVSANGVCASASPVFSDINSPNSTFAAEPGVYTLSWNVAGCSTTVEVTIDSCNRVDFDGNNDYITFKDNFNFNANFSVELWVKPESVSGNQTLFSKRDVNDTSNGYDLTLNNATLEFNWNNSGSISSLHALDTSRWYHIGIVYDSGTYIMYVDGIEIESTSGSLPISNNVECLLGAIKDASVSTNNFSGWIDEVRIWNTAITQEQLQQMMNQEIKDNSLVAGEVIPLDVNGLNWSNLEGYYRMNINCGSILPYAGLVSGKLRNMYSSQTENAPIPYVSANNGNWNTNTTWAEPIDWDVPNSQGIDGSSIDWNIVKTNHTINASRDLKLLGLLVESEELQMDGTTTLGSSSTSSGTGYGLYISHYLKLDGIIDLEGESQLIQKRYTPTQFSESILDAASSGYIERDQQGDGNKFRYNDWSSPVQQIFNGSTYSIPGNNTYNIWGVLRDGTTPLNPKKITFIGGLDGQNTDPIQISNYWLYVYTNFTHDDYYSWLRAGSNSILKVGEGFLMKGTGGVGSIDQNYVFVGRPNNGDIELTVSGDNDYLIGNPYPSAIDANQFITDNVGSITGALYFWDHYGGDSHYLLDYQAGFATYNLS